MEEKQITIDLSSNIVYAAIIISAAATASLGYFLKASPYFIALALLLGLIGVVGTFAMCKKHCLSEVHCAMCGMVFAMMPAFVVGTIHALQTGDFVMPIISGTIVGALVGIPFGATGGAMGRLEAVMAAPMGGIMGSMTGVMVRIYNIDLFMIALAAIVLFVMLETAWMIHKLSGGNLNFKSMGVGCVLAILLTTSVGALSYPVGDSAQDLGQLLQQGPSPTGEVQDINLKITSRGYEPSTQTLKKGVPVRLHLQADSDAGCARAFTIPEFGIKTIVSPGGSDVVEFTPTEDGQLPFSCSMGMARGSFNVA